MENRKGIAAIAFAAGAVAALVLVGLAGLSVVYTGAYNIAATEGHTSFVRWMFDTTFRKSIQRNAQDVKSPEPFTDAMVAEGGGSYKAMCEHCHGGPGAEPASWSRGMRPQPPHLTEAAANWKPSEIFWLVKHGARMTGMPAFGPTHADKDLWSIAAFVSKLPAMTPERYSALSAGGHHHGGGDHHQKAESGSAGDGGGPPR